VVKRFDLVQDRSFLVAAVAAELGEGAEFAEPLLGGFEAVIRPVQVFLRRGEGEFGLTEGWPPVGWPMAQGGVECGPFGEEALEVAGCVVDGEAGVGDASEGVEDFLLGAALVGEDAAVVDLGEAGDVPGVGGVAGAALTGVTGEAFQGGGAEEVHLGPGAALDAVDDQRNAKLVLNVVLGGDALGYDLYRRRAAGGGSADVTPDG
jgi:hypothetical protein